MIGMDLMLQTGILQTYPDSVGAPVVLARRSWSVGPRTMDTRLPQGSRWYVAFTARQNISDWHALDLEEEHGRIQEDEANRASGEPVESEDDTPVYSLVTGELHSVRRFGHRDDKAKGGESEALVVRNKEEGLVKREGLEFVAGTSLSSSYDTRSSFAPPANHLAQRQWTGLDQSEGLKGDKWEPSLLEEGRRGIAKGYRVDGIGREG